MTHHSPTAATPSTATADTAITWETDPTKIPDHDYVTVKDGHLDLHGSRVRFWGHIGHFPNPNLTNRTPQIARKDLELSIQRMKDLGFNLHRLWHQPEHDFVKGDNSRDDLRAYGIYLLKKHGIRIWYGGLNDLGLIDAEKDVSIINDPASAQGWIPAIKAMARPSWQWEGDETGLRSCIPAKWDPRLRALALKRMKRLATVMNPYTGLRYCDDPNFAIWELSNEEWWMPKMTSGQWMKLPKFFQTQLISLWNEHLLAKYKTDANLRNAWGFLFDGESLVSKTVMLAPTAQPAKPAVLNDPNPHAQEALSGGIELIGRDQTTQARAADVIAFFMDMLIRTKDEEAKLIKSLGKSPRLAPMCWDTGTGWHIQCQYLHQQADAVTHCTYINGKHHDPTHKRFPFFSPLEEQPHMCYDKPWVEHNRSPGKPYFVYEIQIKTSTKYRAEFPYEVAALGAIQDWDVVNWHTFGPGTDSTSDKPNTRALETGTSMDLHYGGDEVQLSAMKNASTIFRSFLLEPAGEPTYFVFGHKMLHHRDSMDYSGSYGDIGPSFLPTTYRHGMRLVIDPTLETNPGHPLFERKRAEQFGPASDKAKTARQLDEVHQAFVRQGYMTIGEVLKPRVFESCPIKPTDQIAYDWQRGNLTLDAPGVAAFTGFYGALLDPEAGVSFNNAKARLHTVSVVNPPGLAYPVTPDERYIGFSMTSTDGKSLDTCSEALVSLVSTSFNTGFELDTTSPIQEFHGAQVSSCGSLPVLVARVSATIECKSINGMIYTMFDWEMNAIAKGKVAGGKLDVPAELPVFFIRLTRL